jgi:hypothetical protein
MRTTRNRWRQEVTATRLATQRAVRIRQVAKQLQRRWSACNTHPVMRPNR